MVFVKTVNTKVLKPNEKLGIKIKGNDILIVNLNGNYYAIGNICTHRGCKLSDGKINGESVECPCHGSVFEIITGKVLKGPAKKAEMSYKVKVDNEQILVDV